VKSSHTSTLTKIGSAIISAITATSPN
jgi:hypothetical protein